ncbi:hypothetical protein BDZ89DRAFT_1044541 [Hymenopellis radicata]|nr:hypothetical protein BDZ89DRAFT_1044541 [Hymenopellis radicata]
MITISSLPLFPLPTSAFMHFVEPRFLLSQVAGGSQMCIVHVSNPRAIARGSVAGTNHGQNVGKYLPPGWCKYLPFEQVLAGGKYFSRWQVRLLGSKYLPDGCRMHPAWASFMALVDPPQRNLKNSESDKDLEWMMEKAEWCSCTRLRLWERNRLLDNGTISALTTLNNFSFTSNNDKFTVPCFREKDE